MDSPLYSLPQQYRESGIVSCDGINATFGPYDFQIYDTADVHVWRQDAGGDWIDVTDAVTVTKTDGFVFDTFSVTFAAVPPATTKFAVYGARLHERLTALTRGGLLSGSAIERETVRMGMVLQELRRDIDRTLKFEPGQSGKNITIGSSGQLLYFDENGNIKPINPALIPYAIVLDEDDMASDSPSNPPSQQSVKVNLEAKLSKDQNLSDLPSTLTAVNNLGLGNAIPELDGAASSTTDFDTITTPGWHQVLVRDMAGLNGPTDGASTDYWMVQVLAWGANRTQFAYPYSYGATMERGVYYRGLYSGAWSAWKQIAPSISAVSFVTLENYSPTGDGLADDEAKLDAFFAAQTNIARLSAGTFKSTGHTFAALSKRKVQGYGPSSILKRDADGGNMLQFTSPTQLALEDFTLNMDFSTNGNSGHGIVLIDAMDTHLNKLRVEDLGNDGGSAGSGIIAYVASLSYSQRLSITNSYVKGDLAGTDTNGFLFVNTLYSMMHGNYAENIISFAHELKNDARWNINTNLIAVNSGYALGYGQTTAGDDGADYNFSSGLLAYKCDTGIVIGEGDYNLHVGAIINCDGSPLTTAGGERYGAHLSTTAIGNALEDIMLLGAAMNYPIRYRADRNRVSVHAHDTSAGDLVTMQAGVAKNVTEIKHPGARTIMETLINDVSGNPLDGASANPVISPATGEWLGSISGRFKFKLGDSGASPLSSQGFIIENDDNAVIGLSVDATAGSLAGLMLNKGATANFAGLYHVFSSNYWLMRINNANAYRLSTSVIRPENDNVADIGTTSQRWKDGYIANGVTTTSDAREKSKLVGMTPAEIACARDLADTGGFFQWLDAIEEKGKDKARWHYGRTVQDTIAIFEKHGLDWSRYAMFVHQKWEDAFDDEEYIVTGDDGAPIYDLIERKQRMPVRDSTGKRLRDGNGELVTRDEIILEEQPRIAVRRVQTQKAGDRYGFRRDQLDAFITEGIRAAQKELEATQQVHEKRLVAIEKQLSGKK